MPTIPETSTPQEVFDYVANHLRKQGKQSISSIGCAYRAEGGLSCAVGCLITDAEYDEDIEGINAYDLTYVMDNKFWADHQGLLQSLQLYVHDSGSCLPGSQDFDLEKLRNNLANVANKHNLTFKEPA